MTGHYFVKVYSKKIVFNFCLERKYTILQGDTSSGKSKLYDMISSADNRSVFVSCENESGAKCDVNALPVRKKDYTAMLTTVNNEVFIVDESTHGITSREFAELLNNSNNYFVILTRKKLYRLAVGTELICEINCEKKYNGNNLPYMHNTFSNKFIERGDIYDSKTR